jgi:hypothetical protein
METVTVNGRTVATHPQVRAHRRVCAATALRDNLRSV